MTDYTHGTQRRSVSLCGETPPKLETRRDVGRIRLWAMTLLCLLVWLLPQRASATYVDDTYRYQAMLNGSNTIRIQVPVYDEEGADCWVYNGYLKIKWTDDNGVVQNKTLFWWRKDEDNHDNDNSDLWCKFWTEMGGSFDVTQGNSSNHFTLTKADGEVRRKVYENNDGNTYVIYAVWRMPYDILGKDIKLSWDVSRDGTSRSDQKVSGLDEVSISVPQSQAVSTPQLTMATIAYSEAGKLEIPWFIATNHVTAARYEYIDHEGNLIVQQMPANENSGTIYLDANVPHDNFRIVVSYKDNDGYDIENVSSATQNLTMVHAPVNFHAMPTGKASVQLSWNIAYPSAEDITSTDFFEIQRSLTGEEADFVTIGSEPFSLDTRDYSYTDSTIQDAITGESLTQGGTLDKLTYRVRRMISQNWGWEGNNCASTASCIVDDLHLLRIANYTARWEDERAYTVRVSWDYADEYGAVWDNRAEMKLRVIMTNSAGNAVDTLIYTLNAEERTARYKVIDLTRPCLNYKIEVYVERGTSPLPFAEEMETYFFPIRNASDWDTFRQKVIEAKGQYDVNARLYADISTPNSCGDTGTPYRGIFDGNGHKITITISSSSSYQALFKYTDDAIIRNLHVDGSVSGSNKFLAGFIGQVNENKTVLIENCRSSVNITSTVNGDATNGGFIAFPRSGSNVTLRNCQFDGSLNGENCDHNGGFVGYGDPNTKIYIENSLFAPSAITTRYNDCQTWARMADAKALTVYNSYYTIKYERNDDPIDVIGGVSYYVLRDEADWLRFCNRVKDAKVNYDVNAIMAADITTTTYCGNEGYSFRGTFDGNGHTLTYNNSSSWSESDAAPFRRVGNATFRNLRTDGTIYSSAKNLSGLVGTVEDGKNVIVENCRSSATLSSSVNGDATSGGFAGYIDYNATITFSNCLFDGKLLGTNANSGGGFVGWSRERVNISNSLFNPTTVEWKKDGSSTWARMLDDGKLSVTNSQYTYDLGAGTTNNINHSSAVSSFNSYQANSWQLVDGKACPVMNVVELPSIRTVFEKEAEALLSALGNGWKQVGDKVELQFTSVGGFASSTSYPTPTLPTFYHESIGTIDPTLMTQTRQSSVFLTWETDGKPIDYFTVLRRVKGTESWDIVADRLDNTSYEDATVSPLEDYEYKVRAVNDCEGESFTETALANGSCKHTGLLEGYIRFKDGTGAAGVTIEIASGSAKATATTDESGYFMADDLSYLGQRSVTYNVTPVSSNNIKFEVESYAVTFNEVSNHEQVHEFIISNGYRFSGYVMYDGTSIPVKGTRFRVNGGLMHNGAGEYVETDFEGKFSFYVMSGNNIIQAEMEGHTFTNEGYFKGTEGYVFTDNVAQIYFYDATKVKLTGRVVGGEVQGRLPLDNNLSHNNLGDDLTMVLTLEGDNTSWLVYDNQNPTLSTRNVTFEHPAGNGHMTKVEMQRKRMIVKPDSLTGEYVLMLPPVRWKLQQVYCEGYPTLFQDGQVSEVIDLTECLTPDTIDYEGTYTDVDGRSIYEPREIHNCCYNRIYHAPVEITYRQIGYDSYDYFGDKNYVATTVGGDKMNVPLAYQNGDTVAYTFGYPVFSVERKYPIQIQVAERYVYNGNAQSGKVDMVNIGGGQVTIHNGMKNGVSSQTVDLDENGQGRFFVEAEQTTRLLTSEDALKTVTMTLTQDGTTYEAEPLRGYVLNMFATGTGKDVLVNGQPQLIDILRDPPGGSSSATLSKGSKLKFTYTLDMKQHSGLALKWTTGTTLDNFQGSVAAPSGIGSANGIINSSNIETPLAFEYAFDMEGHRAFSYTMNVNQDITTSTAATMVGADADLYIGMVQNIVVTPMSTIRAIPDSLYRQMLGRLGNGTTAGISTNYGSLVHIAEGRDANGSVYHLVRDESIGYGPKVESQFIHSQKHILTELIPKKVQELRDLMFTGTAAEADALANATGKPVYRSLVDADDDNFGVLNVKDGDNFYYTSTMAPVDSMNYVIHLPAGTNDLPSDEVAEKCQVIYSWMQMIAENEREKLNATEFVTNYDVDGGSKVTYSELFESEYTISNYYHLPGIITAPYFDMGGADAMLAVSSIAGIKIVSMILSKFVWAKLNKSSQAFSAYESDNDNSAFDTKVAFYGKTFKFSILPTMDYSAKDVSGESKVYSRKESFTISMNPKSHLNFDLFRTQTDTFFVKANGLLDVFSNQNFNDMTNYVESYLLRDNDMRNARYARGFVYRTRGGATVNPWENERRTLFYESGRLLDERTKKICNPKITLDKQSVSGIATGAPARFKIYLTNESEQPESATGNLTLFKFLQDTESNPNGAKIFLDGAPLTQAGIPVVLTPGKVVEKTMEVYAGEAFDYEGLKVGMALESDFINTQTYVAFDVHFLREAGPVNIASPGDKWVMNTHAQWNEKRGWFLPITIDGFDKHQHNFDHIEFQYKESLRGEDSWTNLCSYYADSMLMKQASGVCEMIPENGNITTQFYGEGTVMERAYDLRAVLYCRNGNSFLTSASKILSGVKDTRRPQLFGTPEPKDGILTLGNNIIFNFSEDIEYNYLNAITNFEVKGEVNNENVSEAVSVQFIGQASVESEAQRNFSGKNLTIDVMIKPENTGRDMPIFSHGTNGKKMQLWLTSDYRLKAVIDDDEYTSAESITRGGFTQVAMSFDQQDSTLTFYNGGMQIGQHLHVNPYNGTGALIYGRTNETDRTKSHYYEGRMMEARLWYRAMTGGQVGTTYGSKSLTGYEMGLVEYYQMNEGSGTYALDHTQGANAQLLGASWAMPRGLSLHLDKSDNGLELNQNALNRTAEQDYTLMFWFRTDAEGRGTLLSNGIGQQDEPGAENLFNIGFEGEQLQYRSNGFVADVTGDWGDGQWHHYAMTVNRAHNVVNIYVDLALRATLAADSLGGISGGRPAIGTGLTGNIDELCLFAQALPSSLIKSYSTKSPQGDEVGLMTYLSFDRQERQKDNSIELVAYPYSKKVYLDENGDVRYELDPETRKPTQTPIRDYSFADAVSIETLMSHIDATQAAPVIPYEELKNLNFDFVGDGHRLLVDINESNARLNRRNIYVTLRDVEDKNGNAMASPATASYYVTNSSVQWMHNREDALINYGYMRTVHLTLHNISSQSHTFTIENCPKWLTLSTYSDVIGPMYATSILGEVSKDLNVGSYDEILYVTDEMGISEPLYLNVTVEANPPEWSWGISSYFLQHSMSIAGKVFIGEEIDIDSRDIVGVFDRNNDCHGYGHIDYSALTGESNLYLTIYDNEPSGRELYFKMWQYSTGREMQLLADGAESLTFQNNQVIGIDKPVRFQGGESYVQTFDLKEGWNWISFNVTNDKLFDIDILLQGLPWQNGDILTDMNSDVTLVYRNDHWLSSGDLASVSIEPSKAYAIKVQNDIQFPVAGSIIKDEAYRTVSLKTGWNGIGYTPILNLSIETALSDYYDKAEVGDVIKSHDEFAYFTISGGVGRWRGSLQYMKPGEGYMMLRKGATQTTFRYPYYELGSTFIDAWSYVSTNNVQAAAPMRSALATMSLSAVVEGFELEEGDRIVALADGTECGSYVVSPSDSSVNYLSIAGEQPQPLWFAIERDGEIVASTSEVMDFRANAVVGSPDMPTTLNFKRCEPSDNRWYTTSGIPLAKKPTVQGIYIYNGKKVVIK